MESYANITLLRVIAYKSVVFECVVVTLGLKPSTIQLTFFGNFRYTNYSDVNVVKSEIIEKLLSPEKP